MTGIFNRLPFLLELVVGGLFYLVKATYNQTSFPLGIKSQDIESLLSWWSYSIPVLILGGIVRHFLLKRDLEDLFRRHIFSLLVLIPLFLTWGDVEWAFYLGVVHLFYSIMSLYDPSFENPVSLSVGKISEILLAKLKLRPAQIILFSFAGLILMGAFLLMLPFSTKKGVSLSFEDALFMSTSATCVTGLSTVSLSDNFSNIGQLIILILIQVGGLGIMTLSSSMTILLGKSMGMKDRIIMQDLLDVSSLEELFAMILSIIKYTFFIELWGGIVLTLAFTFEGLKFSEALKNGFFLSISAFCNAGFSLFNNSLENFATRPFIHGTIAVLIILGGLGFIVLKEMREIISRKKSLVRLTLHSKIVLVTSIILTVGGTLFIFFGEFLHALDQYTLWEKIQVSLFQSVTLRTAGFNTISLNGLHSYTIYGISLLMFIGASPGSTGGGIKTTTLAILFQSIRSTLKGHKMVNFFDRSISAPLVVRVTALTFISIIFTSFFLLLLMRIETKQSFLSLFFEVISASGTVGLSLGITPFLSVAGKMAIAILMLVGRIGPLTLVLAIGEKHEKTGKLDYPDGRIMIG